MELKSAAGRDPQRETLPGWLLHQHLEPSEVVSRVTVGATSPSPSLGLDVPGKSHFQPEPGCPPLPGGVNDPLSQDWPEAPYTLGLSVTQ